MRDGYLVCGYHGLEMGYNGKCPNKPGQRVRGFPSIRAYPVEERHEFTWVWPGDPDHRDLFMQEDEHAANDQFTPYCSRAKSKVMVLDL